MTTDPADPGRIPARLRDAHWDALERADHRAALAVVRELYAAGVPRSVIVEDLIVTSQERVGELWHDDRWTVEEEAAATAVNEGLVHWLGSFTPPPRPGAPRVVVSSLDRDRHTLGALLVAEALAAEGYDVHHVADGSPDAVLGPVLGLKPRAVLLSATLASCLGRQKHLLQQIAGLGIPVVLGGQAFGGDPARALAIGGTALATGPDDAVRVLADLPERLPRREPDPTTPADREAAFVEDYREQIAAYVVTGLTRRDGGVPADFLAQVDHLVGCVSAALVTGDETILVEAHAWLSRVLETRGASVDLLDAAWELLAEPLRGHPLARAVLLAASTSRPRVREVSAAEIDAPPDRRTRLDPA